ncbi:hypothetical protein [Actinomadura chokoriensis]|uniref:WXG100 family type VII secretion target n=1 Tax=Actinomadura chokoriensis TaxID=454156 RepID=UPI0031F95F15
MGQEKKIRFDQLQKTGEDVGGWNMLAVWRDNFDKVREIVDGMQPGQLETGASAYAALAKRMNSSAKLIYNQGTRMAEAWGGDDAKKAMEAMNKTYRQVQEIESISDKTGKAMSAHAKSQHGWKNAYGSGSHMDGWVKDVFNWGNRALSLNPATAPGAIATLIGNNVGARNVMDNINDGTEQSNNNFPPSIRQDLANPNVLGTDPIGDPPGPGGGPKSPKMPGGPGGPGDMPGGPGGPGDLPGGPGDLPGGPGGPGDLPGGPGGPGNLPGGPNGPGGIPGGPGGPDLPGGPGDFGGPGTDLASLPPGGPGGGPSLGGGGVPGGPPGLGGGGVPGGPGMGPGGPGLGAGPGAFGAGPGAFGKNALGAKGGMTGMGMPMGAGARGGGGDGNEHERSTWLTEDEDVWGGNDDTAPPVIG